MSAYWPWWAGAVGLAVLTVGHTLAADRPSAGVPSAFETIDRNDVAARTFGRQRVAHRGALMQDRDAMRLQHLPDLAHRLRAGGFNNLDPAIDDRLRICLVIGRIDRRKDGHVHTEWLVGHRAAAFDLGAQRRGRRLGQSGQYAKTAGIRYRTREFGIADALHAALNDRMLDFEHLCDARLESHAPSPSSGSYLTAARYLAPIWLDVYVNVRFIGKTR